MRAFCLLFAALAVSPALAQDTPAVPVARRMAADAHPSFAVAAIHLHDPNSRRQGFNFEGSRYLVRNESVGSLIMFAYAVHPKQIVGGPEWVGTDRYDIEGKPDTPGEPSLKQQQEMLRKLLADRFKLHFNPEKRELSVYAIAVAKGGPKLKAAADPNAEADQEAEGHGTETTQIYTSATMKDFAMGMNFFMDRPVVDQSGLSGKYDFRVRYTNDEVRATDPNAPPGMFTAIQEQLGLKLQPEKTATDVLAVDHIERPSEN
jgi:uncharacterized protein (TIGR03435 family)